MNYIFYTKSDIDLEGNNVNISVFRFIMASFLLNTLNFFATNNPYRAYHSGRTAYESIYTGSNYWIAPIYILLALILLNFLKLCIIKHNIIIDRFHVLFLTCFIVASVVNGSVISSFKSLFLNLILYITIFEFSYFVADISNYRDSSAVGLAIRLNNIVLFLVIFGVVFALIQRNRYGVVNFDFSRTTRGEITYWVYLGLHVLATPSSLTAFTIRRRIRDLFPMVIVALFQLAFVNRMGIIYIVVPVLFYCFHMTNTNKRFIVLFGIVLALLFLGPEMSKALQVYIGRPTNYISLLNGRDVLWSFYYTLLKKYPLFGAGQNAVSNFVYTGTAISEVGLLKIFAENGVVVGVIHIVFLGLGFLQANSLIRNSRNNSYYDTIGLLCSYYLISCLIAIVIESHATILNITDFMAWFCLYFLYNRRINCSA